MGSPYASCNVEKVSTVKTEFGAYQSLRVVLHHGLINFPEKLTFQLVSACFLQPTLFVEDSDGYTKWYDTFANSCKEFESALNSLGGGEFGVISEYLNCLARARIQRTRLVHVMFARYQWSGHSSFDRAVMFDMTGFDPIPKALPAGMHPTLQSVVYNYKPLNGPVLRNRVI